MRLCGHKTRAVFDRYAITDEGMLRDGVEKLARLHRAEADGKRTAAALEAGDDTFSTQSPAEALRAAVAESTESADGTTG